MGKHKTIAERDINPCKKKGRVKVEKITRNQHAHVYPAVLRRSKRQLNQQKNIPIQSVSVADPPVTPTTTHDHNSYVSNDIQDSNHLMEDKPNTSSISTPKFIDNSATTNKMITPLSVTSTIVSTTDSTSGTITNVPTGYVGANINVPTGNTGASIINVPTDITGASITIAPTDNAGATTTNVPTETTAPTIPIPETKNDMESYKRGPYRNKPKDGSTSKKKSTPKKTKGKVATGKRKETLNEVIETQIADHPGSLSPAIKNDRDKLRFLLQDPTSYLATAELKVY